MTNGDKIKLRAELAGKAMQGMLAAGFDHDGMVAECAERAIEYADALMAELGLKVEE